MTINLDRFLQEKERLVPFIRSSGQYKNRKIVLSNLEDNWYKLVIGDNVEVKGKASPLEVEEALKKIKKIKGMPIGNEFIPINFTNLERLGYEQSAKVEFQQANTWDVIKAGLWDDGKLYFAGIDYSFDRKAIDKVKDAFEKEKGLEGIKGITPELRYYFIILSLQRDSYRKFKELKKMKLAESEREKRLADFHKTFTGRLQKTVEDAGGKLVRFTREGNNRILVVWKTDNQTIKTVISAENMRVIDAGYCLEGYDKQHTMSSIVNLAKVFKDDGGMGDGGLYITRE